MSTLNRKYQELKEELSEYLDNVSGLTVQEAFKAIECDYWGCWSTEELQTIL